MIIHTIKELFVRDLNKLKEEINLFKSNEELWLVKGEIANSAGNLCLHLVGNLNHFIGAAIGNTGYIRQRELEFTSKNISIHELNRSIDDVTKIVSDTLNALNDSVLPLNYPLEKHGSIVTMNHMLLHLYSHLNYHLGQINYLRRIL